VLHQCFPPKKLLYQLATAFQTDVQMLVDELTGAELVALFEVALPPPPDITLPEINGVVPAILDTGIVDWREFSDEATEKEPTVWLTSDLEPTEAKMPPPVIAGARPVWFACI